MSSYDGFSHSDFDYVAVVPRAPARAAVPARPATPPEAMTAQDRPSVRVAPPTRSGSPIEVRSTGPSARSPMGGAARAEASLLGVYEISKLLSEPRRLEETLAGVVNLLSSFLRLGHGSVTLVDTAGDASLRVGSAWVAGATDALAARLPQPVIDEIVATGVPMVLHDLSKAKGFAGSTIAAGEPTTFIGVPIRADAAVVGVLAIDRAFEASGLSLVDGDTRFLVMVANLIGQTVKLHRAVSDDRERLIAERARLEKELSSAKPGARSRGRLVGASPAIRAVAAMAERVAPSSTTVLLRGESGTGKELFAQLIHEASSRAKGPFIKLNCAALPENVLESELFGHEKGAFTGALNARVGRFEAADGGTLFLDEIGEISPTFQAKLLRVLQEGEFERVGSNRTTKVDVRIIAATNRDLESDVIRGQFRADLYYRLSVVPITLPPLRERRGDIPVLAQEFLRRFDAENGTRHAFSREAVSVLSACAFPGNVRELENCVRRTATLAREPMLLADDFACQSGRCLSAVLGRERAPAAGHVVPGLAPQPMVARVPIPVTPLPVAPKRAEAASACACAAADPTITACPPPGGCAHAGSAKNERERLVEAMERAGWVQAKAARLLDLTPRQIGYALKKHGVELQRF